MTHDERRLLCAVARAVVSANIVNADEIRRLIKIVQKAEHRDGAEIRRRRVQEEDDAIRRMEPR